MIIPQPQDFKAGGVSFSWNKDFSAEQTEKFNKAQKFIDSECIRLMVPYTPTLTTVLRKSATLGTVIGTGVIHQNTPYARYQYYGKVYGPNYPIYESGELVGFCSPPKKYPTGAELHYNTSKAPKAGKLWFERMKADKKTQILNGAKKIIGG